MNFVNPNLTVETCLLYALCGGVGGLVSEYMAHGCLEIPSIKDKKLYLGSLGGVMIGAITGIIGDHDYINSFVYGCFGITILRRLLDTKGLGLSICNLDKDTSDKSNTSEEDSSPKPQ